MAITTQARTASPQPSGTVIGAGLTVDGEIGGNEPLTIYGAVKGKISLTDVVIIEKGSVVEADVEASEIKVYGAKLPKTGTLMMNMSKPILPCLNFRISLPINQITTGNKNISQK